MLVPQVLKRVGITVMKRSPEILTAFGLLTLGGTVVCAVKAAPKAQQIINDMRGRKIVFDDYGGEYTIEDPVSKMDIFCKVAPIYIPTVIMALLTATCMIGSTRISLKRHAVAIAALSSSELALKEYQSKVLEKFGEKKERSVQDDIAKDTMDKTPVSNQQIVITGKGDSLCFDFWSGTYFLSDYEKVRSAVNSFNAELLAGADLWLPLNEFYYLLGIPQAECGVHLGYDIDHRMEVRFSSHVTDDGRTALVLSYDRPRPRT